METVIFTACSAAVGSTMFYGLCWLIKQIELGDEE